MHYCAIFGTLVLGLGKIPIVIIKKIILFVVELVIHFFYLFFEFRLE